MISNSGGGNWQCNSGGVNVRDEAKLYNLNVVLLSEAVKEIGISKF